MSKIDPREMMYEGCDLEAMSQAPNYYRWIISQIKPYLGKSVVEVGAGAGSFSKELLTTGIQRATLIEPTKNMFKLLESTVKKLKHKPKHVTLYCGYLEDLQKKVTAGKPDTFVYINVFEHIEHDASHLKMVRDLLPTGGHVIIFVPAHQALFSKFDESIGHFRRYSKESTVALAKKAGLDVVKVRYMDIMGTIPWWLSFVVLKRTKLSPGMVGIYDRFFMPIIRAVETIAPMPVGKNVLLIARKR